MECSPDTLMKADGDGGESEVSQGECSGFSVYNRHTADSEAPQDNQHNQSSRFYRVQKQERKLINAVLPRAAKTTHANDLHNYYST